MWHIRPSAQQQAVSELSSPVNQNILNLYCLSVGLTQPKSMLQLAIACFLQKSFFVLSPKMVAYVPTRYTAFLKLCIHDYSVQPL